RFILRLPTPSVLLGGGIVIDPLLALFKRSSQKDWQQLLQASGLEPDALITYELESRLLARESELLRQALISRSAVAPVVERMLTEKSVIKRGDYLILKRVWDQMSETILKQVEKYHVDNPHLEAMPLASLHSQVSCPEALLDLLIEGLISQNKLARFKAGIKLASYSAGLAGDLEKVSKEVVARLQDPASPAVTRKELFGLHKQAKDVYAYLNQRDEILEIGGLVFLRATFDKLVESIVQLIRKEGKVTVAQARDVTGSSRKVILPVLEEMDRRQITRRSGDYRELA
ncbi:MAG: SelB C-terminal domain-containing protein, partial [bacterium]